MRPRVGRYILKDRVAVEEPDLMTWARWLEATDRQVAESRFGNDIRISTVFLGIDHGFGHGPPMLFETMVFGGSLDQEQDRYSTWVQAQQGHNRMLARVEVSLDLAGDDSDVDNPWSELDADCDQDEKGKR